MAISYIPDTNFTPNTNGIINSNDCQVQQNSGMDIQIGIGQAWIFGQFTHTGDPQVLTVANNTSGSMRRDLIVIQVQRGTTNASYQIKTGSVVPTQNSTTWELPLAVITVANNETQIDNADIADIRVISNDLTPVEFCTLNHNTNIVLNAGSELIMPWNTELYDPQLCHNISQLIRIRQTAWYEVKTQFRWQPANSTTCPILFRVYGADNSDQSVFQIFQTASLQLNAGTNVDFIFQRQFKLQQNDFIFVSVTNTTQENITLRSVGGGLSPQFQLNFVTYEAELI